MQHRPTTKLAVALALALCALLITALPALGDAVYHTQHIPLLSSSGTTAGFVQNIHANGPMIFAQERYVLLGATPGTYTVNLNIYFSPDMSGDPVVLTTTTFQTNERGNGVGKIALPPSAAEGLHGQTIYIVWTVSSAAVTYHTSLQTVVLD